MEKNKDYWMEGLPYLDGIEFYHGLPFSPELGSALLAGRTDYARLIDPVTRREVDKRKEMKATDYYQSVIQAVWVNAKRKPFDDPRVRRAMHLVFDRPVLVDVVKDVAPMLVGGFVYPFSTVATPTEELVKRLGYQPDTTASIKEARALLAAAGHGNGIKGLDFVVREVASFKLWSQAIQAMLQQALNIECNLRTVVESVWFDDTKAGNFDLSIGAIVSTLIDPSDYFNTWFGKNGPQNYSQWENEKFQGLMAKIDGEVDPAKRQGFIREAEMIFEENPPLLPICWEKINDGWYNYVKGHNPYKYFGIYDVVRMDTFWLDK
jgi:ABC-type oligopeptide transport system substrate-binding subunit